MKKFVQEFKEFITKGNVLDMAIGVIIGTAFKDIVTSLTDNIISPILGIFGGVDFSEYKWIIGSKEVVDAATGAKTVVENSINYGSFITAVINFLIMALIIFLMVKAVAKVSELGRSLTKKKEEAAPEAPTTKVCPFCKSEIAIDATRCAHCTSELDK
ncbi:MAG: large conductance mechanosensitive channel protein MscL [Clostridia bacterium]|nr:large conductance mechanosensitive channel protein MscL [Clostridia bacterium]